MLIILKGFRDQSLGMPFAALCANWAWELLFFFVFPFEPLQQAINFIWLSLDCIMVGQFLIFSKRQLFPSRNLKTVILLSSLALSILLILGITVEFHDYIGRYSAFGINLMMSILFIRMARTQGVLGQSVAIACTKMIGTLCASLLFYSLYPDSLLLLIMYVSILVLDVFYFILIWKKTRNRTES
ncbi:hypothetical protein [Paenibacillus caui]|uniref:transmembrane-type terpene cyclase n=1 Tax=Paenibacillus caui TaxID=2873927 RepID=UPI001CA9C5FC|nr:hypothetical protein [Paenibacillus caui]